MVGCRWRPVEHHHALVHDLAAVGAQPVHVEHAVEPDAALRPRVHEVHLPVVVPQRAGIDPALRLLDQVRRLPGTARIARAGHEDAAIRVAHVDPEIPGVKTDRRRPDALAVLGRVERRRGQPVERVTDDRPVDEVGGVEDREAGRVLKARRHHVEVVARARDVRVGVVREDHRVAVGPVAAVGNPGTHGRLRGSRRRCGRLRRSERARAKAQPHGNCREAGRTERWARDGERNSHGRQHILW